MKSITTSLRRQFYLILISLICLILSRISAFGQPHELLGLGTLGVFSVSEDGSQARVLKGFDEGIHPTSRYLTLAQGKLWGITTDDGLSGFGTIFSINQDGTEYHDVYHFNRDINSACKLLLYDDKLWGTTQNGGTEKFGTIFSLDLNTLELVEHVEFLDLGVQKLGRSPGSLTEVNGQLWGVTSSGGENMKGTIFRYDPSGSGYEKVHDFQEGNQPVSRLTYDGERLWGTTDWGGDNDMGTLFALSLEGDEFEIIHHFTEADGRSPGSELTYVDDVLYGSAEYGGANGLGTIFTFNFIDGFSKIFDFSDASGGNPTNKLIWVDTVFVGMTTSGLAEDLGGFFAFNPESGTARVLEEFDELYDFRSGLSLVGSRLWGTTYNGGNHAKGSIFSYSLDSEVNHSIFDFGNHPGSASALSELLLWEDRFWGTTFVGGDHDSGVLFSLNQDGSDFQMHHHFTLSGGNPLGRLIIHDNSLWGVLMGAGQHGGIYKYENHIDQFSIVHYFNQDDGHVPYSGLTNIDGFLWGVTELGGADRLGLIYYLDTEDPSEVTVVHEFQGTDGQMPHGELMVFNGKLYGTSTLGGDFNVGTLYSIDLLTNEFVVEHHFSAEESVNATGSLTAYAGRLWGTSQNGGALGAGSIFAFDPELGALEVIHEFTAEDGSVPSGALKELNGNLYGTTYDDGAYYDGVFFVITDGGTKFIKLRDFNKDTGGNVLFGGLITAEAEPYEIIWDGNQWHGGVVPQVGDDVQIEGNYSLSSSGNMSIHSIRIQPGATLTIEEGFNLEVFGHLINNGELIIESGGSLITYEGNMHGGAPVIVERSTRFSDGRYSFVGSPVNRSSGITGGELGQHVYSYDEVQSPDEEDLSRWVSASAEVLQPGRGYTQAGKQVLTFEGIPNDGTITYAGSYENDGWHMVSNPYPAAIDLDAFLDANMNTTGAIYLWDDNGSDEGRGSNNDYIVVSKAGATDKGGDNNEMAWNGHIGSVQGFFVKLDGEEGDIVFTEEMRVSGNNDDENFFRKDHEPLPLLRLNLSTEFGMHLSQSIVAWKHGVSGQKLLKGYDAAVFNNRSTDLLYVPKYDKKLAIHTVGAELDVVPLGYNVGKLDTYRLTISEDTKGSPYYLRDLKLKKTVELSQNQPYIFESSAGEFPNRFELIVSGRILTEHDATELMLFVHDKHVVIKNSTLPTNLRLMNLSGQLMVDYPSIGNGTLDLSGIADGIYLLIYGDVVKKIALR